MGLDEKALGQRLQKARQKAGLTQQELCQKAGLSYSTLAKIERGAIKAPSVFTVAAIAMATGVTIEKLLDIKTKNLAQDNDKKVSKSGVRFVFFDVNGTLVRFFERAFTQIAKDSGKPVEQIETLFWRHDSSVCSGANKPEDIDKLFASELDLPGFNWEKYYLKYVEVTPHSADLIRWVSTHYEIGLLTNNWPGFTQALIDKHILPNTEFKVIVESATEKMIKPDPKIYKLAQERSGFKPSEILLVDDSPAYLSGADNSGWHALWFDGYRPEEAAQRVKLALTF